MEVGRQGYCFFRVLNALFDKRFNMNDKSLITKIVKKFLAGRFPEKTEERVQRWLIKDNDLKQKEQASLEYWNALKAHVNEDTYQALERVNQKIGYIGTDIVKVPLHRKIARIAAVFIPLILIAGGYFYYATQHKMIEIQVAYGEERHLFLPDSSEIWLNAGTVIRYPKSFTGSERTVYLNGEAYFSVRKNESKPFVVTTDFLSVHVLGTQFNVKAYGADDKVIATLTNGRVEVKTENESRILKPNEQLSFEKKTSVIRLTEIMPDETNGWLTGQLLFTDASFHEIRETLERKFDVSFDLSDYPISDDKKFTVKFYQNENLNDILEILQDVIGFKYETDQKRIILK